MNKQEQIRSRTWKYFWLQKLKEVNIVIITFSIFMLGYFFVKYKMGAESILCSPYLDIVEICNIGQYFFITLGWFIVIIMIGFAIRLFVQMNWERAKDRAEEDFE